MFTVFHLSQLGGLVIGGLAGYQIGEDVAGVPGSLGGLLLGLVVGRTIGRTVGWLPLALVLRFLHRSFAQSTLTELRSRLEREYFIAHLIIAHLVARGEPLESFRGAVAAQLNSRDPDVQRFGRGNARRWFPDLVRPDRTTGPV